MIMLPPGILDQCKFGLWLRCLTYPEVSNPVTAQSLPLQGSDILDAAKQGNVAAVRNCLRVKPEDLNRQVPDGQDKGQRFGRRWGDWESENEA